MKISAHIAYIVFTLSLLASTKAVPATVVEWRPWVPSQQMSVCVTPIVMCYVPGYAPSGSPCWCNTPYGPVNGRVR